MKRLFSIFLFSLALLTPAHATGVLPPIFVNKAAGASCSPGTQAAAFIARTSGLSTNENIAVCTFINALFNTAVTTAGLTGTLGSNTCAAYFLATNNTTSAALNVISTSFSLTSNGSMTFTADIGYAGDGSTGYLDTGVFPAGCTTQSQNSAGMTALVQTNRTSNAATYMMGVDTAGTFSLMELLVGGNVQWDMNDAGTFPTVANTTTKGAWTIDRTGASTTAIYHNGSSTALGTSSAASSSPASLNNYFLFAFNSTNAASGFSSEQASCFGIHAGFNGADSAAWQAACNSGLAILGKNVY